MGIFRDERKLMPDYPIENEWDQLPHRTQQLGMLWRLFTAFLEEPWRPMFRVVQVVGPAGSGKTCTLRLFGRRFAEEAGQRGIDLRFVYVNLRVENGRRVLLYRGIARRLDPVLASKSLSAGEILVAVIEYLKKTGRKLFLVVDELDYYVRHYRSEGIVYDLTRLYELVPDGDCGVVGVVFLARSREFHKLLDPAELSSLGRTGINFPPYSPSQVADILARRAEEALRPGTYSEDILEMIADVVSKPPAHGDMRYALDLLLYSAMLAEREGYSRITAEHVRTVCGSIHPTITSEDILTLPTEEKLVLLALARSLEFRRTAYVPLRDIRESLQLVCEEYGFEAIEEVEEHVQDLADRGIVDIKALHRIGISGVPAEELDRFLADVIRKVVRGLGHGH